MIAASLGCGLGAWAEPALTPAFAKPLGNRAGSFSGARLAGFVTDTNGPSLEGVIRMDRGFALEMIQKGMPPLPNDRLDPAEEATGDTTYTVNISRDWDYAYYLAVWTDESLAMHRALWLVNAGDRFSIQLSGRLLHSRLWVAKPNGDTGVVLAQPANVLSGKPVREERPDKRDRTPQLDIPTPPVRETYFPDERVHPVPDQSSGLWLLTGSVALLVRMRRRLSGNCRSGLG